MMYSMMFDDVRSGFGQVPRPLAIVAAVTIFIILCSPSTVVVPYSSSFHVTRAGAAISVRPLTSHHITSWFLVPQSKA